MKEQPTQAASQTLLEVLVAVALTGAVEELFRNWKPGSWALLLILTITTIVTIVNFYHGKVATQLASAFQQAKIATPALELVDFWLNTILIVLLNGLAFSLHHADLWPVMVYAVRGFDLLLVAFTFVIAKEVPEVRKAQGVWFLIDLVFIAIFGTLQQDLFTLGFKGEASECRLALSFVALSLGDVVVDYLANHKLYFARASSWSEPPMAKLWDELQGELGMPESVKLFEHIDQTMNVDWMGQKVLDLGCGNGWLARRMSRRHAKMVVGVDHSDALISRAKKYADKNEDYGRITYRTLDFTKPNAKKSSGMRLDDFAPFDYIFSFYSVQDCERIDAAFDFVAANVAPGGHFIVIFESEAYLRQHSTHHSMSMRQWLTRGFQLICWKRSEEDHEWDRTYVTLTRHWGRARYEQEARAREFSVAEIKFLQHFTILDCVKG